MTGASKIMHKGIYFFLLVVCMHIENGCITGKTSEKLPEVDLQLADSSIIRLSSVIRPGLSTMLIYFSPDCEHCQKETEEIMSNKNILTNHNIIFITTDPLPRLTVFKKYFGVKEQFVVARDFTFKFVAHFKYPTPPITAIYDSERNLHVIFLGTPKQEKLIEALKSI